MSWDLRVRPRKWQVEALAAWKTAGQSGIAKVVTGAGKTLFAEMCIAEFRKAFPSGRVIILVPTLALIDQWYVSLQEDLGVGPDDIGIFSGAARAADPA